MGCVLLLYFNLNMDMKDRMWKWIDILYLCRVLLIEINIKVDE